MKGFACSAFCTWRHRETSILTPIDQTKKYPQSRAAPKNLYLLKAQEHMNHVLETRPRTQTRTHLFSEAIPYHLTHPLHIRCAQHSTIRSLIMQAMSL